MSTKRENKTLNSRKRRGDYILDNSDDGDHSEDNEGTRRRRINYNPNVLKTSITPRKGRDLERTRSRPGTKVEVKSPAYSDNTDGEIEEEVDNDDDDNTILYANSLINSNIAHDCCKERLEIGKNILIRSRYKTELQRKEFKEKIQRVFKEIYTYYYNPGQSKTTTKTMEKDLRSLSLQINDRLLNGRGDFLHLFVKLLHENVSVYIKTFKDSIKEKCGNRKLMENYHYLKRQVQIDFTKDFAEMTESTKLREEKPLKMKKDVAIFCKDNQNEIVSMINDLNQIYTLLKNSSSSLNQVFKIPFGEVDKKFKKFLSMDNIHKEEFFNVIINDDFVKSLIIEVKNRDIPMFISMRPIISTIEEEISTANKDMKDLKSIVEKIEKEEKEDVKEDDLSYLNDAKSLHQFLINTSKNNNRVGACINVNCKNNKNLNVKEKSSKLAVDLNENSTTCNSLKPEISLNNSNLSLSGNVFSPNISKVKLKNIENQHKNLDELYEYIIADDNKQTKKQSKKNGNKNGNNSNNVNGNANANSNKKKQQNVSNVSGLNKDSFILENDREVEEFKNKIKIETIHANNVRKVKPKITFEWIQFISKV